MSRRQKERRRNAQRAAAARAAEANETQAPTPPETQATGGDAPVILAPNPVLEGRASVHEAEDEVSEAFANLIAVCNKHQQHFPNDLSWISDTLERVIGRLKEEAGK